MLHYIPIISFVVVTILQSYALAQGTQNEPPQTPAADATQFEIKETKNGLTIEFEGKLFARYVIDVANKPYLWPIIGPTGKAMTRAYPMELLPSETKDQRDHPHHRGLLFGHESVGLQGWSYPRSAKQWATILDDNRKLVGGDSWHEKATYDEHLADANRSVAGKRHLASLASIKHRKFTSLRATNDSAVVIQSCDHVDRLGKRFLMEERQLVFRATDGTRVIDFDQTFIAKDGSVVMEGRKDSGLGIRVPTTMAIDSGKGGAIMNSDGLRDAAAWGKPAKWCDYNGPVDGEQLGIAFLNHPSSYRFPTRWHVRNYGLFAANPFAMKAFDKKLPEGTTTLKQGNKLRLRHRLIFHDADMKTAEIERAWQQYAKEKPSDESSRKK